METKSMLYLVSEYASQGEIFGKKFYTVSKWTTPFEKQLTDEF